MRKILVLVMFFAVFASCSNDDNFKEEVRKEFKKKEMKEKEKQNSPKKLDNGDVEPNKDKKTGK